MFFCRAGVHSVHSTVHAHITLKTRSKMEHGAGRRIDALELDRRTTETSPRSSAPPDAF